MSLRGIAAWGPVVLCEALVLFLSSLKDPGLPNLFPNVDKVAHFIEYAGLGGLLWRALRWSGGTRRNSFLLTLVLIMALAAGDENWQKLWGRDRDFWDWVADCFGSTFGVWVMSGLERWLPSGWARPPDEPGQGKA